MKKNLESLKNKINNSKDEKEIQEIISNWEIDIKEYEKWISSFSEKTMKEFEKCILEFDMNKMPYMLESLYRENNKIKFSIFCMILEITFDKLPFITNLENIPIFKAKFESFANTLAYVVKYANGGIADCMYLILLNSDPTGSLLTEKEREDIIQSINDKLEYIANLFKEKEIEEDIYMSLEILLDVACYINDEKTFELIKEIDKLNINQSSRVFLIKAQAVNNIQIDMKKLQELIDDDNYTYKIVQVLENINKLSVIPKDIVTQKMIAKSLMIDWLIYPTELGENPENIELVDTLEKENIVYYIYKFTAKNGKLKEHGEMIGLAGGFKKGKITSINTGNTFSTFETIQKDYIKQAEGIIELISEHWKKRAEENIRLSEYCTSNENNWDNIQREKAKTLVEYLNKNINEDLFKMAKSDDEVEVYSKLRGWLLKFYRKELLEGLKYINYDYKELNKTMIYGLILTVNRNKQNVNVVYDTLVEANFIEKMLVYDNGIYEIITKDFGKIHFRKAEEYFVNDKETLEFMNKLGDKLIDGCHEVTLHLISKYKSYKAVTAICTKGLGHKYYHSFVLDNIGNVIDLTGNLIMPKDEFYMINNVQELNNVKYEELLLQNEQTKKYDESGTLFDLLRNALYKTIIDK